jgi:hypothetical protein
MHTGVIWHPEGQSSGYKGPILAGAQWQAD